MNPVIDTFIKNFLKEKLNELEVGLGGDVFTYYGAISDGNETAIRNIIEELASDVNKREKIFVVLTTPGGSAIAVERYVNILRNHYDEVNFIVPDYAYSAGTIFCMSGDNIYMDYFSVLGPIDPQVKNKQGVLVPALGYLDKINELIEKAKNNTITQAEFIILKDFDLAELKGYEQAKELTIALLKKWLVKFKFKNWDTHGTTPGLIGEPVTPEQKTARADEIARMLSDNSKWKSHGRPINLETLKTELKLKVEDYGVDVDKKRLIRSYYDLVLEYVTVNKIPTFVQTRVTL